MKKRHGLLLFFASLATLPAYALTRANTATFTVGAGYEYFSSQRHIKNTSVRFGIVGYNFTHHWGIEGLFGFFNTRFNKSVSDHRGINGNLYALDGVYHFNSFKHFEPYALMGVGATGLSRTRYDSHNVGNINAGFGAQFFANPVVALRAEVRDFYTIVGGRNDVFIDGGVTFFLDLC